VLGTTPEYSLEPWRTADQRYYVSDTRRFGRLTGWFPRVPVVEGVERLATWLLESEIDAPALVGQRVAS
jgi:CDP-paratose 2-epimerase